MLAPGFMNSVYVSAKFHGLKQNIHGEKCFAVIRRSVVGASFTKFGSNQTNLIVPINFTICQFNCTIFVKEQWNLRRRAAHCKTVE